MKGSRLYDWDYNLYDVLDTPCHVTAEITGTDTPWEAWSDTPPEYRDVEIRVYIADMRGNFTVDVTDEVEEIELNFIDDMRMKAIEMEDDKIASEQEDVNDEFYHD